MRRYHELERAAVRRQFREPSSILHILPKQTGIGSVQESSGLETPRTRFATEYVFATLSSALRAGISEREQRAAQGRFTAPGRDESFATETRVWSWSRFRHTFQPLPRYLTAENWTGLKHAGKQSLQNGQGIRSNRGARASLFEVVFERVATNRPLRHCRVPSPRRNTAPRSVIDHCCAHKL